jgi:serine/threonine protein kinase
MPITVACSIMKQLLDAIALIHAKDIIHRNITPHNIVFLEEDNILSLKIINFESSLYVGDSEEIESHCTSMLKDLEPGEFL